MSLLLLFQNRQRTQPTGGWHWRDLPPAWRDRRHEEEEELEAPLEAPVAVSGGVIGRPATVGPKRAPPRPQPPSFDTRVALAVDRIAASVDAEIDRYLAVIENIEARRRRRRREDEELILFE